MKRKSASHAEIHLRSNRDDWRLVHSPHRGEVDHGLTRPIHSEHFVPRMLAAARWRRSTPPHPDDIWNAPESEPASITDSPVSLPQSALIECLRVATRDSSDVREVDRNRRVD